MRALGRLDCTPPLLHSQSGAHACPGGDITEGQCAAGGKITRGRFSLLCPIRLPSCLLEPPSSFSVFCSPFTALLYLIFPTHCAGTHTHRTDTHTWNTHRIHTEQTWNTPEHTKNTHNTRRIHTRTQRTHTRAQHMNTHLRRAPLLPRAVVGRACQLWLQQTHLLQRLRRRLLPKMVLPCGPELRACGQLVLLCKVAVGGVQ